MLLTDASTGPALVAAIVYASAAFIILRRVRAFHPHPTFGTANAVTLARFAVACAFAAVAAGPIDHAGWALFGASMAVLAADGIDGWLARRLGMESRFGARFDMETDAFFVLVLSIIAWRADKAGAWVLLSGGARYLYVAAGAVVPALRKPLEVSFRRKLVAVIQIGTLVALLAPIVQPPVSAVLALLALACLIYSFGVDIVRQVRSA